MGTLHEHQYKLLIISRSLFLRMRIISQKLCRENKTTHFMFNIFFPENYVVYEICVKLL